MRKSRSQLWLAVMTAGLVAAVGTVAWADDPPKRPGPGGPGRAQILKQFDKNGNGKLDPEEREALRKAFLERFDTNGDGQIDASEREAARKALRMRRGGRRTGAPQAAKSKRPPGGKRRDTPRGKGNAPFGKMGGRAALLRRFDRNGDGKLDEQERAALRAFVQQRGGGRGMRAQLLRQFDKDGDGKLNEAERRAAREAFLKRRRGQGADAGGGAGPRPRLDLAELLKRFDEDGDGKLSPEERKKALAALRKKKRGAAD